MCFYIKVMHFKLVILTRVVNQTPSYLIHTHFLNMMEELHQIWPSASNLCNITRREIYIWLKYSTSLLKLTVNITVTTEALREHDMLCTAGHHHEFTWNDKMWTKTWKENQFYCDGVALSVVHWRHKYVPSLSQTNTLQHGEFTGACLNISLRKRTTNSSFFLLVSASER